MERTRRETLPGWVRPGLFGAFATALLGLVHLRDGLSLPELAAVSAADRSWRSAAIWAVKFSSRSASSTLTLRAWMSFGRSDLVLRILPLVLAAASAALVARLAATISGRRAAVFATAAFVLDAAVTWTFDLATPLLALPAALVLCLAYVEVLRRPRPVVLLAWAAASAVLVAAEPFAVVLPAAQFAVLGVLWIVGRGRTVRAGLVAASAVALAPSVAVLAAIAWCVRHFAQPRWDYGAAASSRDAVVETVRQLGLPGGSLGLAGVAVGLAFLSLALLQGDDGIEPTAGSSGSAAATIRLCVAVSSAAPVLAALLAALGDPGSTSRDVRFCLGPLAVLVGHGLAELRRPAVAGDGSAPASASRWLRLAGLGMIVAWGIAATLDGARARRDDRAWRSLAQQVFRSATPEDGLVVIPGDARLALERYAPADAARRPSPLEPIDPWGGFDLRALSGADRASLPLVGERARDTRQAVWVVTLGPATASLARSEPAPSADQAARQLGLQGAPDAELATPVATAQRYRTGTAPNG